MGYFCRAAHRAPPKNTQKQQNTPETNIFKTNIFKNQRKSLDSRIYTAETENPTSNIQHFRVSSLHWRAAATMPDLYSG